MEVQFVRARHIVYLIIHSMDILNEKITGKTLRQMIPGSFIFYLKEMNNGTPLAMMRGLLPMTSEMTTPGELCYAPNFSRGRGYLPEC